MAAPIPNAILDKIDSTGMGMHSGLPVRLIPHNQVAFSTNITHRGGYPKTRPAIRKIKMVYTGETETPATEALWQGAGFYRGYGNNQNCLVSSIAGKLFRYQISNVTATVSDITPPGPSANPTLPQAWLFQAEDFLIRNDAESYPMFFDGAGTRYSKGSAGQELPPSAMGTYCNGRVIVALPDRRSYIAGDLVYSTVSGTPAYNYRDSVLHTKENQAILGGRSFAVPINAGPITAIFAVSIPDTSLGQGPVQIGTEEGIFSTNLPLDATLWTTTQQPTQVISLPGNGPTSQLSVSLVNGDAWYRGVDGLRSYVTARRDFNTWINTALSFEMEAILPKDTQSLLGFCSSARFNNRLLTTCSPYAIHGRGVAHRGLIAIDFNNISSLTQRSQPDYDGMWTGLPILQIITGKFNGTDRCFIFALDSENKICLYELTQDDAYNFDFDGTDNVRIESWLISGALFGNEAYPNVIKDTLKKLLVSDLFLEELAGNVELDVKYRSDQYPFWIPWKGFSVCATSEDCTAVNCPTFQDVQDLYATFKRLPEPGDGCNPATGRLLRSGYYFQVRVQWTGHAELNKLLLWAVPIPETIQNVCVNGECVILKGCTDNYFSYSIEG